MNAKICPVGNITFKPVCKIKSINTPIKTLIILFTLVPSTEKLTYFFYVTFM